MGLALSSCLEAVLPAKQRVYTVHGRRLRTVSLLGEGGNALVYLVQDTSTRERFALKRIAVQDQDGLQDALWEVGVHKAFDHPGLLPLLDYVVLDAARGKEGKEVLLLLPYIAGGTLQDYLDALAVAGSRMPEEEIWDIFTAVCVAVRELHTHDPQWAHRDIKPLNVLLSEGKDPVLMDFGSTAMARVYVQNRAQAMALQEVAEARTSPYFRPPELFTVTSDCVIDERVDIWALGCLLYACAFRFSPFESAYVDQGGSVALAVLNKIKFPEDHPYSPGLCNLIRYMLTVNWEERPNIEQVLDAIDKIRRGKEFDFDQE